MCLNAGVCKTEYEIQDLKDVKSDSKLNYNILKNFLSGSGPVRSMLRFMLIFVLKGMEML